MISIHVHACPLVEGTQYPDFVREAFIGLTVKADLECSVGEEPYPDGLYFVTLENLLEAMAVHNPKAHQFLRVLWGSVDALVKSKGQEILFPFLQDACEVVH